MLAEVQSPRTFRTAGENGTQRPLRVLELRCADGAGGGPEKTILHGAARTDRGRFTVTVCYLRDVNDDAFDIHRRAERLGLDYVEIRQRHGFDPAVLRSMCRLVREREIDLIHAHDYKTDLIALMLARLEGIIPLATVHGWTGDSWRERWLYYPADKCLLARFPRLIAVSRQIRDELVAWGVRPERIDVILNGIDPAVFRRDPNRRASARARYALSARDVVIGAVGRLALQKRFDLLLQAIALVRREWPDVRLLIAGEGDLRPALEAEAIRLELGSACRLLGHVNDIAELHHALDVFVQSSDYEGTPNVVLEAMALETPVVATNAGGTVEVVRPGIHGLLVPPRDPHALARTIEQVLRQPTRTAQRVRAARLRVENELSFATRMRAVERIYEALTTPTARRRASSNSNCRGPNIVQGGRLPG